MSHKLIHHSALSLRKLRSIKIEDKSTVIVSVLDPRLAYPRVLSDQQFFGQFGVIVSIRMLKQADTVPREAYICFASPNAAEKAIVWSNYYSRVFVNARHGFQIYCHKFINGTPCYDAHCSGRHSWCATRDILNFQDLVPSKYKVDALPKDIRKECLEEKTKMVQNIAMLTAKCNERANQIAMIKQRMQMMKMQNDSLKKLLRENDQHQHQHQHQHQSTDMNVILELMK